MAGAFRRPTGPPSLDVRPFTDTLAPRREIFRLGDVRDALVRLADASPPVDLSGHQTVAHLGADGGWQTPDLGDGRQSLGPLVERDGPHGLRVLPIHRPQVYWRQFIGAEALPVVSLAAASPGQSGSQPGLRPERQSERQSGRRSARHAAATTAAIEIDFTWELFSDAPPAKLAWTGIRPIRLVVHWHREKLDPGTGASSPGGVAAPPTTLKIFGVPAGQTVIERFEPVTVPDGAAYLRLDLQVPASEAIRIADLRIWARDRAAMDAGSPPAPTSTLKSDPTPSLAPAPAPADETSPIRVTLPAMNAPDDAPIVRRGVTARVRGAIDHVHIMGTDHRWTPVVPDGRQLLHAFQPHVIALTGPDGTVRVLRIGGAEAVEIHFRTAELVARVFDLHPGERAMRTTGVHDADGVRRHRNRALAPWLPAATIDLDLQPVPASGRIAIPTLIPGARLASLVFTEHADQQTPARDRTVMYGGPEASIGDGRGLFGRGIPVTKSVFALRRSTGDLSDPDTIVSPTSTLEDAGFADLIRTYQRDHAPLELGLHTPSEWNDGPDEIARGMAVAADFGSRIWIDHANDENLEDLNRLGAEPESPQCMLPELRARGYRFAWSYIDLPGPQLGNLADDRPANSLFWLPSINRDADDPWRIWFFSTRRIPLQPGRFSREAIDELIDQGSVSLVHCYFSHATHGHFETDASGAPVAIASWFDAELATLAEVRDAGDLHLATLSDWADHVLAAREVRVHQSSDGRVQVDHPGRAPLPEFTLAFVRGPRATQIETSGRDQDQERTDPDVDCAAELDVVGIEPAVIRKRNSVVLMAWDLVPGRTSIGVRE